MNTATFQTDGQTNDVLQQYCDLYVASRGKNRRHHANFEDYFDGMKNK